mmetsp:Transcript_58229/g.62912  ORF Transcript_58229/g.62912 Transcript_58229/m.62912 type:complete len:96 (+) Transcript_58229:1812-2099(+)
MASNNNNNNNKQPPLQPMHNHNPLLFFLWPTHDVTIMEAACGNQHTRAVHQIETTVRVWWIECCPATIPTIPVLDYYFFVEGTRALSSRASRTIC